jgi:L-threonylcarbamoyladenylate synthase
MAIRWHVADAPTSLQVHEIARVLTAGGVALLPTDTIYGLHAVATDDRAVERIGEIKGRDDSKPYVVIASGLEQLVDLGIEASADVLRALNEIWPAPLTAILPLRDPIAASRGRSTLAVRIPDLAWLNQLTSMTGPLVSTSANRAGEPPVEGPDQLAAELQERIDAIVDAGIRTGEPSAILDLTGAEPRFLREGHDSFTQKVWKSLWKSL